MSRPYRQYAVCRGVRKGEINPVWAEKSWTYAYGRDHSEVLIKTLYTSSEGYLNAVTQLQTKMEPLAWLYN